MKIFATAVVGTEALRSEKVQIELDTRDSSFYRNKNAAFSFGPKQYSTSANLHDEDLESQPLLRSSEANSELDQSIDLQQIMDQSQESILYWSS